MFNAGGDLVETAAAYLDGGGSLESASLSLFVHTNTVRYRVNKIREVTGRDITTPRGALATHVALVLGRQVDL